MSKLTKGEMMAKTPLKKNLPLSSLSRAENPCNNCYNTGFVPQTLDYLDLEDVVISMIRNYKNNQYQAITSAGSVPSTVDDARCVHFSLNKLKSFIYEIESQCCALQCKDNLGELGIRFYYGAYNRTAPLTSDIHHEYAGKHTLVLVPTYTKMPDGGSTPQHVDFCPDWFVPGSLCVPESLDQGGATYTAGDAGSAMPATAQMKTNRPKSSKKVLALVGGFDNKEAKQVNTVAKKLINNTIQGGSKGRPGDTNTEGSATVHTLLNHGNLMPPPVLSPGQRYADATLLNC